LALPWTDGRAKSLMGDHILATPLFSYTFRFCLEERPARPSSFKHNWLLGFKSSLAQEKCPKLGLFCPILGRNSVFSITCWLCFSRKFVSVGCPDSVISNLVSSLRREINLQSQILQFRPGNRRHDLRPSPPSHKSPMISNLKSPIYEDSRPHDVQTSLRPSHKSSIHRRNRHHAVRPGFPPAGAEPAHIGGISTTVAGLPEG